MQGYSRVLWVVSAVMAGVSLSSGGQQVQRTQPAEGPPVLAAVGQSAVPTLLVQNRLDAPDRPPFYLKLSLQLAGADGAKVGTGTAEYWWAGAKGSYFTLNTPTLHDVHATWLGAERAEADRRLLFLVDVLLRSAVDPGWVVDGVDGALGEHTLQRDSGNLRCLFRQPTPETAYSNDLEQLCADAGGWVRLAVAPPMIVIRNHPVKAGAALAAEDLTVAVSGVLSLAGHVEALHSFDPEHTAVPLTAAGSDPLLLSPFQLIGRRQSGPEPIFPAAAKAAGQQGTVALATVIDASGKVVSAVPLRGPSPELARSAAEAVRLWSYQPFVREGKAVAVTTIVPVTYSLR